MRNWHLIFLTILLSISVLLAGCTGESDELSPVQTEPDESSEPFAENGELVILFTGGLENVYGSDASLGEIGYAALAEYRETLEDAGSQVVLLDGGDSVGQKGAGAFEGGDALWDIVDAVGYTIRVPGVLELSEGVDALLERSEELRDCIYLSCNLIDLATGTTVFDPYVIMDAGDVKIGFVGITTPDAGERVHENYGLCQENDGQALYDVVQQAIDDAADAGADYVIAVGNLGTDPGDSPWTSAEVIANTTGLAAFLDCGSGSVIEGNVVVDKDDYEIPVCAAGAEFHYVGQITLDLNDGSAAIMLLDVLEDENKQIKSLADDLTADMEAAIEPTEPTEK